MALMAWSGPKLVLTEWRTVNFRSALSRGNRMVQISEKRMHVSLAGGERPH